MCIVQFLVIFLLSSFAFAGHEQESQPSLDAVIANRMKQASNHFESHSMECADWKWLKLELERRSSEGDADASYQLAELLASGKWGAPDRHRIRELYLIATRQNHADACFRVARQYSHSFRSNYAEMVRLYQIAADQNHMGAQYYLAMHLERGRGIQQNLGETARLYRRLALMGSTQAQMRLANMLRVGQGVEQNILEASYWYALSGTPAALENLREILPTDPTNRFTHLQQYVDGSSLGLRVQIAIETVQRRDQEEVEANAQHMVSTQPQTLTRSQSFFVLFTLWLSRRFGAKIIQKSGS